MTENLKKINANYYTSDHGFYIRTIESWLFLPFEKEYDVSTLLMVINNLNILTKQNRVGE